MGMDQDGSSPHSGRGPSFLHGATSPSYLPGHTPPHGHEHFPYPDQLSVYSSLGQAPPGMGLSHGLPPGADTDISNDSSPRGYPDFPPSPDSWLGEPSSAHYWPHKSNDIFKLFINNIYIQLKFLLMYHCMYRVYAVSHIRITGAAVKFPVPQCTKRYLLF